MTERIKASLLHLCTSIFFISVFAGFIILHFYPGVFFDIEYPVDALKILIPADIISGPLLTLVIYKKGKPGLTFDLIAIAVCQTIVLAYGCWSMYSVRPGFLVFNGEVFYSVPHNIDQNPLKGTPLAVGAFSSPKIAALFLPGDATNRYHLTMQSINAGVPIQWQSKYYIDFQQVNAEKLLKASIKINRLKTKSNKDTLLVLEKIIQSGKQYALIPVIGSKSATIVAVNIATKQFDYILDISPF